MGRQAASVTRSAASKAAFLAASRGSRCFYLGPDLPPSDLADAARRLDVAAVALSVVTRANEHQYVQQIEQLSTLLAADTAIWIGGYSTDVFDNGNVPAACTLFSNLDDYLLRLDVLQA